MKKILYINYILQYGHVNFDTIHINALLKQGFDVKVITHRKMAMQMSLPKEVFLFTLPDYLDRDTLNGVVNRIMYLITLLYIRVRLGGRKFDQVIISNVEEMSLCALPVVDDMLIIAHSLYDSFQSKIKRYFIRRLSLKHRFVVFNEHMKIPFEKYGINDVKVVSHGCMPPYKLEEPVVLPNGIGGGHRLIFHPSHRPNEAFVRELMKDSHVQECLEKWDAYLLLRDRSGVYQSKGRILILSDYLSDKDYRNILLKSEIILLAYPDNFLYKVSGVSYECLSNKKKMLVLENTSFYYCRDYYNYNMFFSTPQELADRIDMLFGDAGNSCVAELCDISPDYASIIE